MPKLIVGINGLAQHGKDTTAAMLQAYLAMRGVTCDIIPFAKPLKDIARYVFDMTDEDVNTSAGKKRVIPTARGLTSREIQQKIGTESFRDVFYPEIWTDFFTRAAAKSEADVIAIPDMRFDNEIVLVSEFPSTVGWDSVTLKVFNPNVDALKAPTPKNWFQKLKTKLLGQQIMHISEKPQPDSKFDAIVINNGTLDQLKEKVEHWAEQRILPRLK